MALSYLKFWCSVIYISLIFTISSSTDKVMEHSSVSLVDSIESDYGLDDQVLILGIQTSSGAHPASYPVGTVDHFPRGKVWPGCDPDHLPPSSAKVKNE
jgi:hypothetical protein